MKWAELPVSERVGEAIDEHQLARLLHDIAYESNGIYCASEGLEEKPYGAQVLFTREGRGIPYDKARTSLEVAIRLFNLMKEDPEVVQIPKPAKRPEHRSRWLPGWQVHKATWTHGTIAIVFPTVIPR